MIDLLPYGLARAKLDAGDAVRSTVGRVCRGGGVRPEVLTAAGRADLPLAGAFHRLPPADWPVIGDWVGLSEAPDPANRIIERILPRQSSVRRVSGGPDGRLQMLAANVDVVLVCFPVGRVHPYLVESLAAVAESAGFRPMLVITKT